MTMDEAVKRILALGRSEAETKARGAEPPLSARAMAFLGRMYGPTAVAMGAAFDPARISRPDNPVGAAADFGSAYVEMRRANRIGGDKYFHCRANCDASRRGPISEWTAEHLSNGREAAQMRQGETLQDALEDQFANRWGRQGGAASTGQTCTGVCGRFRPDGLPARYR